MQDRTCGTCGGALTKKPGRGRWPRYCSQKCRNAASWARAPRLPCVECGSPTGWRATESRAPASPRCRRCMPGSAKLRAAGSAKLRAAACAWCGTDFTSVRRSDGRWTLYCSKSCARKAEYAAGKSPLIASNRSRMRNPLLTSEQRKKQNWELSNRRRRARLRGVEREPYTTQEIAERDGFRCWLCGRKVDMALTYPHPRSASIDHVVPLSKGGDDTRANVRLAHLGENVARLNKAGWVQQLLVG